jgi:hypothetical protein
LISSIESNEKLENAKEPASILQIYAQMTYGLIQCRFHEFMISIMGMTVFDCAELWLLSPSLQCDDKSGMHEDHSLMLIAAVYKSSTMQKWVSFSERLRLKVGFDIPGKCVESAQTQWDSEYNSTFSNDTSRSNPRSQLANELSVKTALSVYVPGLGGNVTCGVLSFYSSQCHFDAEPLMVSLIEKATQLMLQPSV